MSPTRKKLFPRLDGVVALASLLTLVGLVLHGGYHLVRSRAVLWFLITLYAVAFGSSVVQLALGAWAMGLRRRGSPGRGLLRRAWVEVASIPLVPLLAGQPVAAGLVLWLRQAAVLVRLVSDTRAGRRLAEVLVRRPGLLLLASFAIGNLVGAVVLTFPAATASGTSAPFLTALFTATSALCVTGLIVVDTPTYWSTFGQAVILGLIQVGGIGIMTFSTGVGVLVGGGVGYRQAGYLSEVLEEQSLLRIEGLLRSILSLTLLIESAGAIILFFHWYPAMPAPRAAYLAVFHSISAFCNAGFSLWTDSLMGWVGDAVVTITIAGLIVLGGLGFPIVATLFSPRPLLEEAWQTFRRGRLRRRGLFALSLLVVVAAGVGIGGHVLRGNVAALTGPDAAVVGAMEAGRFGLLVIVGLTLVIALFHLHDTRQGVLARIRRMTLHTRMVLVMSATLVAGGAALFLILEWSGSLRHLDPWTRVLAALFQSVTARTAGFNTVDLTELGGATALVLIVLMFVGGSPASTAGGIKTTTLGVLLLALRTTARRAEEVEVAGRTIPKVVVYKSVALLILSEGLVVLVFGILLVTEEGIPFPSLLFETVSAFGTVGLSLGATSELSPFGRVVITLMMYVGRVGPLTLAVAVGERLFKANYRYPAGHVMVG